MGATASCNGEPEPEIEELQCSSSGCVHPYLFPMYVVKVRDFLQMVGPPEPHHILQEKGLLHEWQPGMFVIFVSHQWLGFKHPDPTGAQLAVLRCALQGLMDETLKVEADITSRGSGKRLSSQVLQKVAKGYLFLDWFAIPQITPRMFGVNEIADLEATRSDAALAVQSIPAYVEGCDLLLTFNGRAFSTKRFTRHKTNGIMLDALARSCSLVLGEHLFPENYLLYWEDSYFFKEYLELF